MSMINGFFKIHERGSSIGVEIRSGIVAFLTCSYILLITPQLLISVSITAQDAAIATTAVALSSAIATFISALTSNLPITITPGVGVLVYLCFGLIQSNQDSLPHTLTCSFIAGLILLIFSFVQVHILMDLLPNSLQLSTIVGIGLLIALISLEQMGFVQRDENGLQMGDLTNWNLYLSFFTVIFLVTLIHYEIRGALLVTVVTSTVVYYLLSLAFSTPFGFSSSWQPFPPLPSAKTISAHIDFSELSYRSISAILSFVIIAIFDIAGVLSCATISIPSTSFRQTSWVYTASGLGSMIAALFGAPTCVVAAESLIALKEGGRTGLTALVSSSLFFLSLVLVPLLGLIPRSATAPILFYLGAAMAAECSRIRWNALLEAIPSFFVIVLIPFTLSIAVGLITGIVCYLVLIILSGDLIRYFRFSRNSDSSGLHTDQFEKSFTETSPLLSIDRTVTVYSPSKSPYFSDLDIRIREEKSSPYVLYES